MELLDRIIAIPEDHWLDLQQQLAAVADLRSCAVAISRFREEYSDHLEVERSGRSPSDGRREINIWGHAQERELANLRSYAEFLLTEAQDAPAEMLTRAGRRRDRGSPATTPSCRKSPIMST